MAGVAPCYQQPVLPTFLPSRLPGARMSARPSHRLEQLPPPRLEPHTRPLPMVRITCHAPHPDTARDGDPCGTLLGDIPGAIVFVTTSRRAPESPDGDVWVRCTRRECGIWNRFRLVPID